MKMSNSEGYCDDQGKDEGICISRGDASEGEDRVQVTLRRCD